MNNLKKFLFVLIILFSFTGVSFAEDIIPAPEPSLNINATVDLPASCDITDANGASHHYTDSYLAICALKVAIDQGNISSIDLVTYPGVEGLFINSINGIGDPASQYWALYQNNNYATLGLSLLPISSGDIIKLQLNDFLDNDLGSSLSITINSLISESEIITPTPEVHHHSSGSSHLVPKTVFDINKALEYLASQQKKDGSFGEEIYTDWASLAFASSPDFQEQKGKIKKYFLENKFTGTNLTDYERHTMALLAINLNPYENNRTNYIEKITNSFDGTEFGDKAEINDDIFALIVLQNTGYTEKDEMIQKTINFIISKQKENGSWNDSIDMTGAGIQSLSSFKENESIKNSLEKAIKFLESKKQDNNWGNISSSSWALQGEIALGNEITQTEKEYFGENQDENGNIKIDDINNKIWQTSYAVTSLSGKTWNQIMQKFPIPVVKNEVAQTENTNSIINPKIETILDNSNQAKFINKIEKYTKVTIKKQITKKPVVQIQNTKIEDTKTTETPKKQGWFRKLIGNIFGF